MTGIYQCYCNPRVGIANFWEVFSNPDLEVCGTFAAQGFGGNMVSMPCGITNSIMTNIGAGIIMKLTKMIRFKSNHWQIHVSVLSIWIMSWFNSGILPMYRFEQFHWMPPDFTAYWILFYSKMIQTSMILSNLMPYVGPLLKIAIKRCCCCCRRKNFKPNTHLNPEFPLERRYAAILMTVYNVFTYGVSMPALFVVAAIIFVI